MRTLILLVLLGTAATASAQALPQRGDDPAPTAAQADRDARIRAALAAADIGKDQRYTRAEWRAAGRRDANFDALDANKDGVVTTAEIRAAAVLADAERDKKPLTPEDQRRAAAAREALAKADANNDKQYSKAEWVAAGRQPRNFDLLDTDRNGMVTPAEIRAGAIAAAKARAAVPPMTPVADADAAREKAARARMFADDINKDGRWSQGEWARAHRSAAVFKRIDANHDGMITAEELLTHANELDDPIDRRAMAQGLLKR